jgi:alpha-D-ribose 1-methylphosphonate 5-phosphate C-P lyase
MKMSQVFDVNKFQAITGRKIKEDGTTVNVADVIDAVYDDVNNLIKVKAYFEVSDIQIGAVEIKDATTDTRLKVKTDGVDNAIVVTQNSQPLPTGASTSALQTTGNTSLSNIDGKLPATLSNGNLKVSVSESITQNNNVVSIGKGAITTALNAISVTTTSSEIDVTGYNAVLVSVNITGTGTWKVDVRGRFDVDGTVMDIFDNNNQQLTTGNLTASRMRLFVSVPNLITIVATEVADGATCTVRVQPINI